MARAKASEDYSAKHLAVLEGLDAVRKRPGMYIGSTDGRGLMHCLWEIVDNAVDEALVGFAKNIDVVLHPDGSVEVRDDGRGIPVDVETKSKLSGVELVMTKLHAGGKFGGGSYAASGGLHGVGASVVNALSERLDVEVDREGKVHLMSFKRGVPGVFDGDAPDSGFTKQSGLRAGGKAKKGITGTRIRYWADRQIFDKSAEFDLDALRERARQTAFLVPGLAIRLHDHRVGPSSEAEVFQFAGGIASYCDHLSTAEAVTSIVRLTGVGHFHETVPVLDDKGHLNPKEVERELKVEYCAFDQMLTQSDWVCILVPGVPARRPAALLDQPPRAATLAEQRPRSAGGDVFANGLLDPGLANAWILGGSQASLGRQ
mgnify:CR=1 FL=1